MSTFNESHVEDAALEWFGEQHNPRPDIVVFINRLPLAVLELKNAADEVPFQRRGCSITFASRYDARF